MMRPIAIQILAAIYSMAVMAGGWLTQAHGETTERPNFVFIITDDQSWQHAGCYGDTAVRTPSMDGLAEKGFSFV